jgi:succinate dehydrogenase / fumarate reductase, cytochrome b subunit
MEPEYLRMQLPEMVRRGKTRAAKQIASGRAPTMADAKDNAAGLHVRPMAPRPLSPHLSIFRPYINMTMSILHRITGAANYMGSLLLVAWLASAASGEQEFNAVSGFLATPIGLVILFGYTWSLMHHMLGGIRHFMWDFALGIEVPTVRVLSWATLFGSLTLTALIWWAGLWQWGKL